MSCPVGRSGEGGGEGRGRRGVRIVVKRRGISSPLRRFRGDSGDRLALLGPHRRPRPPKPQPKQPQQQAAPAPPPAAVPAPVEAAPAEPLAISIPAELSERVVRAVRRRPGPGLGTPSWMATPPRPPPVPAAVPVQPRLQLTTNQVPLPTLTTNQVPLPTLTTNQASPRLPAPNQTPRGPEPVRPPANRVAAGPELLAVDADRPLAGGGAPKASTLPRLGQPSYSQFTNDDAERGSRGGPVG